MAFATPSSRPPGAISPARWSAVRRRPGSRRRADRRRAHGRYPYRTGGAVRPHRPARRPWWRPRRRRLQDRSSHPRHRRCAGSLALAVYAIAARTMRGCASASSSITCRRHRRVLGSHRRIRSTASSTALRRWRRSARLRMTPTALGPPTTTASRRARDRAAAGATWYATVQKGRAVASRAVPGTASRVEGAASVGVGRAHVDHGVDAWSRSRRGPAPWPGIVHRRGVPAARISRMPRRAARPYPAEWPRPAVLVRAVTVTSIGSGSSPRLLDRSSSTSRPAPSRGGQAGVGMEPPLDEVATSGILRFWPTQRLIERTSMPPRRRRLGARIRSCEIHAPDGRCRRRPRSRPVSMRTNDAAIDGSSSTARRATSRRMNARPGWTGSRSRARSPSPAGRAPARSRRTAARRRAGRPTRTGRAGPRPRHRQPVSASTAPGCDEVFLGAGEPRDEQYAVGRSGLPDSRIANVPRPSVDRRARTPGEADEGRGAHAAPRYALGHLATTGLTTRATRTRPIRPHRLHAPPPMPPPSSPDTRPTNSSFGVVPVVLLASGTPSCGSPPSSRDSACLSSSGSTSASNRSRALMVASFPLRARAVLRRSSAPSLISAVMYVQCGWRRRSVGDPGFSSRSPVGAVGVPRDVAVPEDSRSTSGIRRSAALRALGRRSREPQRSAARRGHGEHLGQAAPAGPGRRCCPRRRRPDRRAPPSLSSRAMSTQSPAWITTSARSISVPHAVGRSEPDRNVRVGAISSSRTSGTVAVSAPESCSAARPRPPARPRRRRDAGHVCRGIDAGSGRPVTRGRHSPQQRRRSAGRRRDPGAAGRRPPRPLYAAGGSAFERDRSRRGPRPLGVEARADSLGAGHTSEPCAGCPAPRRGARRWSTSPPATGRAARARR